VSSFLAYLSAAVVALWGVMHAVPAKRVIEFLAPPSSESRLIVTQEWIGEAFTMWTLGGLIAVLTAVGGPHVAAVHWSYRVIALAMVAFAMLTAVTGARSTVVWFKICVVLLLGSAALLAAASFL
jgi:hypothetical protein